MAKIVFAYLMALIAIILISCGGGGSDDPIPFLLANELILDQPSQIVRFTSSGRPEGATKQVLRFQLETTGYFSVNESYGHFGVMMHADFQRIETTRYHGVGWIAGKFGNGTWGTRNLPGNLTPIAVIETWAIDAVETPPFDFLLAETISKPLQDNIVYDVEIISEKTPAGNLISYTMTGSDGIVVAAPAPLIDANPVVDLSLETLAFFNASEAGPYSIRITNLTSTWSKS